MRGRHAPLTVSVTEGCDEMFTRASTEQGTRYQSIAGTGRPRLVLDSDGRYSPAPTPAPAGEPMLAPLDRPEPNRATPSRCGSASSFVTLL